MAGSSLRVALVGCGRISRNHFEAIASTPGVELSAVCEIVPELILMTYASAREGRRVELPRLPDR